MSEIKIECKSCGKDIGTAEVDEKNSASATETYLCEACKALVEESEKQEAEAVEEASDTELRELIREVVQEELAKR